MHNMNRTSKKGRKMSKRVSMLFALVAFVALAAAGSAFASDPVTFDEYTGASKWTYQDNSDSAAKTEGSYKSYEASATWDPSIGVYTTDPHGGYATTSNKCKTCHAVHRATGSFALLRVDNADHACDFCHIGAGRHSELEAYFGGTGGIYSSNGHTIGSGPNIPDSSVWQWVEATTITNGSGDSTVINVRRYLEDRNKLMRYVVHGNRFIRVGPQRLRCMSCHQVHNATRQIWRPLSSGFAKDKDGNTVPAGTQLVQGYKLLRNAPSGGIQVAAADILPNGQLNTGTTNQQTRSRLDFTYFDPGNANDIRLKVPEGTVNIATGVGSPNTTGYTAYKYFANNNATPTEVPVYETSLSFWCADCHNLNIAGKQDVGSEWGTGRTGENMLGDRAHAVPNMFRTGTVASAGSQCYMCHNNDMPLDGTNLFNGADCGSCHVTPEMYHYYKNGTAVKGQTWAQRDDAFMAGVKVAARSDFPHSGPDAGMKLLNARDRRGNLGDPASATSNNNNQTNPTIIDGRAGTDPVTGWMTDTATFGTQRGYDTFGSAFLPANGDGLDKVCKTCHGGMKRRSIGHDK